jgi:L-alanine-DL-glutamate epimerase-like enolase superfamily enzyme
LNRRAFLARGAAAGIASFGAAGAARAAAADDGPSAAELARIGDRPVLDLSSMTGPVKVASLELLRQGRVHLVRARSADGAEAVTVPNPARMEVLYPLFVRQIAPHFVGKDARDVERLQAELYRQSSIYKLQGLALWVCVAAVEMALLELLGRTARRPVADFFGGVKRRDIPVYAASGNRGNAPEAEIEHLRRLAADAGVRALKLRLGGRMSRNADSPPGRSERLIALAREAFGPEMTLYADANSSYDVPEAVRIGRLLEAHGYGFYEEPCEFDDLWATKAVADALSIPVAGGEQEFSLHRWRWTLANRGVDIAQPDLHYGGGLIRATRVARMAAAAGMKVVPHMSGGGLGYVDVVHFASFTPNAGDHMEFKGNTDLPVACDTSSLRCEQGRVRCPSGPGFGVTLDPAWVAKAVRVEANT